MTWFNAARRGLTLRPRGLTRLDVATASDVATDEVSMLRSRGSMLRSTRLDVKILRFDVAIDASDAVTDEVSMLQSSSLMLQSRGRCCD